LTLPAGLPVPQDDGACDHLVGAEVPSLTLPSSTVSINLAAFAAGRAVLYIYPRTGKPDRPVPEDWDAVPGARGCTPQSCGFRDHAAALAAFGARVAGLSTQPLADQEELTSRLRLPYPVISDPDLLLAHELDLPTFTFEGVELYKRVTLILARGRIEHVFYPVFPPDRNAAMVLAWLKTRG
jgi:peroxiredoxin